jgi:hypothetical protein
MHNHHSPAQKRDAIAQFWFIWQYMLARPGESPLDFMHPDSNSFQQVTVRNAYM